MYNVKLPLLVPRFPLPSHPAVPPEHLKEPLLYMRKAQVGYCLLLFSMSGYIMQNERSLLVSGVYVIHCMKNWVRTNKVM